MRRNRPTRLGKFELIARIATGGMAEIYLARQKVLAGFSRLVVVKRILPHLAEEARFVQMFVEEARLAALINHPNVVQIHDVVESKGEYFIAMEYIHGVSVGNISRHMRKTGQPVPVAVAAEIVAQACEGLHAAHELRDEAGRHLGLVHRDISPPNLMISRSGTVKLLDFGIAKAQGSAVKTSTGIIRGKFPYMSPEQCRGDALDRRTDIFSLGIVFHELLTARRFFRRSTDLMILKAITEEDPPAPGDLNSRVPEKLDAVVLKALQRERDERFATTRDMCAAVRDAVSKAGMATSPQTVADHLELEFGGILDQLAETARSFSSKKTGTSVPVIEGLRSDSRSSPISDVDAAAVTVASRSIRRTRRRQKRRSLLLAACGLAAGLALALGLLLPPGRPSGPPLYFGFVPSFSNEMTQAELGPLARYLEGRLNRRVEIVVPKNYDSLREDLLSGALHFASLSALQYLKARARDSQLRVIAAHSIESVQIYQCYLLVLADGPVRTIEDLRGKRMCYVDVGSTSGYLMPRHFLRLRGLDPDELFSEIRFCRSHPSVMRDLLAGRCDAGAIFSGSFTGARSMGIPTSRLSILAVTGQVPFEVVCTSPQLPAELADELREALLGLDPRRDMDREIVSEVFRISGFIEPQHDKFNDVEEAARSEGLLE